MPELSRNLFSQHVTTVEVTGADHLDPLFDSEAASVAQAVAKRQWDFRAGRHCARQALEQLGHARCAIESRDDRSPIWPDAFVGSITHTGRDQERFAAAAVARASQVRSLGLDAEQARPLDEDLLPRILTDAELTFVDALPEPRRRLVACLHFSAKEAVYKCQYPLTGQFLGFHDVELELRFQPNCFLARLRRASGMFAAGSVFNGRFHWDDALIVTGVELGV